MAARKTSRAAGSQNTILLALMFAAPAAAGQLGSQTPTNSQSQAASSSIADQVDPRARTAWLHECRRRMGYSYEADAEEQRNRQAQNEPGGRVYDYCEAYFDDYYRTHRQRAAEANSRQRARPVLRQAAQ
jgi:hypothetical protein